MRAKRSVLGRTSYPVAAPAPSPSFLFSPSITPGRQSNSFDLLLLESTSLIFVCRTRLGVDAKRPGGERQFSGMMDVYVKTIKADGLMGLYRGFGISCTCIFIYRCYQTKMEKDCNRNFFFRGLYFGLFDSLKPLGGLKT